MPFTPPTRLPCGLLGMLALVLLAEAVLARHPRGLASSGVWDWRHARNRAERSARDAQVLAFGDSQVKLGVVPRVLESETGLPTYNLALIAGQAPATYDLLDRALASGARPSAVIVNFLPTFLSRGHDNNLRLWSELLSPLATLELSLRDANPDLLLTKLLPSYRTRSEVRQFLLASLLGIPLPPSEEPFHRRNWTLNQGAMILPPYPFKDDPEAWYRDNYPDPWTPDPVNALYLDRFLALAASRHITVYWLLPPIDPAAQALCDARGQDARVLAFVRSRMSRFPNLTIVDARHSAYNRAAFVDTVHLHADPAVSLTLALSHILRTPGPRWRTLPDYRKSATLPVETLEQSRLALATQRSR